MVGFAGAEFWDFAKVTDFARDAEVGHAFAFDGGAEVFELEFGFVADGDEGFAFVFIRPSDNGDLAAEAELRERAGEGFFDCCEADHFTADFGEAF